MSKEAEAAKKIIDYTEFNGDTAVILGSGLGGLSQSLKEKRILPYSEVPYYPQSSIEGHDGKLTVGLIQNESIIIARGRVHCYEGFSKDEVVFPIKVLKECGVKNLIITNSSGSLSKKIVLGTIMIVNELLDCTFQESIKRPILKFEYQNHSLNLVRLAKEVSSKYHIKLTSGNYCWVMGPMYETPEEIQYFKNINGTAVGMSAFPEVEEARKLNLNTLTLSLLTNYASGLSEHLLTHKEVLENALKSKNDFAKFIINLIKRIKDENKN